MSSIDQLACPECGASAIHGKTCHEKFEEILALEYGSPAIFGAVHHITVICYNLQHPDSFTEEALAWMQSSLRSIIEEGLTPAELRERAGKKFKGSASVKRHTSQAETDRRTQWSLTVLDIRTDDPQKYIEDITAWARSMLNDLI
ncbi:MAG TPA: DUF5946 family protein [Methanotrichaceae archaeon]|nr:DUF5946 family protein [Methanotrichaceae archaeon]